MGFFLQKYGENWKLLLLCLITRIDSRFKIQDSHKPMHYNGTEINTNIQYQYLHAHNKIPLGHDINEILLKVALNTITPLGKHTSVDVTSKVLWQLSRNQHCKFYEKES